MQTAALARLPPPNRNPEDLWRLSSLLAQAIDFDEAVEQIARYLVSTMATWCAIDLLDESNKVVRAKVLHRNSEKSKLSEILQRQYPASPFAKRGVYRSIFSRQSFLLPLVSWEQRADNEEHLRILNELGSTSYMCVPMIARDSVIGSIMFLADDRVYNECDLEFAKDLAGRFALVLENLQLIQMLKKAVEARDEFLAVAAHELRTPLTSIMLNQALLRRSLKKEAMAQAELNDVRRWLNSNECQTRDLADLVDKLFDVTRVRFDSLDMKSKHLDLGELVEIIGKKHASRFAAANCSIEMNLSPNLFVFADPIRIEQVISNLLMNATKFGAGKPISIAVVEQLGEALVTVRDFGIGISSDRQRKIFERFERLDSPENVTGLGLGLYISKGIIEKLGGRISVESYPGEGASFSIRVPLASAESEGFSPNTP